MKCGCLTSQVRSQFLCLTRTVSGHIKSQLEPLAIIAVLCGACWLSDPALSSGDGEPQLLEIGHTA